MKPENIVLTGGGTGGHLSIVNEIKKELNMRGIKPIFIGSSNGLDKTWFENDDGFEKCFFLDSRGVMNKGFVGKVMSVLNILKLSQKVGYIFDIHNISKVVSVGGYSAAPASIAAIINKKYFAIHEQNAKMGMLNRLMSYFADEIFSSYSNSSKAKNYPVAMKYFDSAKRRTELKTIIFLGGSQGSKSINNFAIRISKQLIANNIKIIHQTGKNDFERVSNEYKKMQIDADVFAFSSDLALKMSSADLAVSRAGASTLWELSANLLPSLFVPYPYAAANHQFFNANYLVERNMAAMCLDEMLNDFSFDDLRKIDIYNYSKNLEGVILPNGTKEMVDEICRS